MSSTTLSPVITDPLDSVNSPRHPFGLPLGTIRGVLSLLICGFFWLVLLWERPIQPLLGHFFMLALVLLVFSPYSKGSQPDEDAERLLPRLLRFAFIAGTVLVVAFVAVQFPDRLRDRLTPDPAEFKDWWITFLATTFGGFAAGKVVRLLFGADNLIFQTLRAWTSLVGMLMLVGEIVFWVAIASAENKPDELMRYWQSFELALVAAYFGTRA